MRWVKGEERKEFGSWLAANDERGCIFVDNWTDVMKLEVNDPRIGGERVEVSSSAK